MLCALLALIASPTGTPADPLITGFANPPHSAKPHTWWHWMDGNVTREGITADLEAMKNVGIGGAHIFDVGQGVPAGPVDYNTPEWRELFAHAIFEAKRLGLEMTVHNCAGWSSSGGPWVEPKDAMKKVAWSVAEFQTAIGATYSTPLPKPESVRDYYRDIALYVFPTPAKASSPHPLQNLTGLGPNPGAVERLNWPVISKTSLVELHPDRIRSDGTLNYRFPAGNWTILRMGFTLTGAQNVASRDSGRGLEVDKMSGDSLNAFFEGGPRKYLDRVLPAFRPEESQKGKSLTTVLIDSYETGYSNWTGGLRERFDSHVGYDPRPFLPALAGYAVDSETTTLGFLYDFRQLLAQQWAQQYTWAFARRVQAYGLQLAIEPYGNGNFDPFSFARPAGLIMGEYWVGDSQLNPSVKHSSSVAHVFGHKVVGAEALTAMPEQAGWRNQPKQWKPFADLAMTKGINRVIYHRFAHQPWVSDVLPGMTMGPWGSHVDRTNTIWPYLSDWNTYLSRCQYLLQQGTFVGDVLLFTGEDAPQSYAGEGQDLPKVPEGYDFDYCGVDPLFSLKVRNGRLVLPSGGSYAVLALPNSRHMSLRLARKIKELVAAGAHVVGPAPSATPSLGEANAAAELRQIASDVWGPRAATALRGNAYGKGRIHQSIHGALSSLRLAKDFAAQGAGIEAIHRRIGNRELYFVASREPYPRSVTCSFRRPAAGELRVELWNAETGQIEAAPVWRATPATVDIPLQFDPDGSVFVVISPGTAGPHLTDISVTSTGAEKPKPPLRILKATYGDFASGKTADVTGILRKAAGPFSLRISASNSSLGGDPALNIVKELRVSYQQGLQEKTATVRENQTLMIGDVPEPGTPPVYEIEGSNLLVWKAGTFRVGRGSRTTTVSVRDQLAPVTLSGAWHVRFPAGWDAPTQLAMEKLRSWTEHPDFGVKHFSGTVTYSKKVTVPAGLLKPNRRLILDLGDVRELCKVHLNGKQLATLWKPPYRIDITKAVRSGQNDLTVEVTNLWVNRLIGDEQFPDDMGWRGAQLSKWPDWFVRKEPRPEPRRKTFTTWRHNTKDTPLMPSGLLGPVVLRPVKVLPLR